MSVLPVGMGSSGGYEIPYSLRFRASNSAYLSRTFNSAATDSKKMTFSAWLKRGKLGAVQTVFGTSGNYESCYFQADDTLRVAGPYMSAQQGVLVTSQVFRDPTAHLHIVVVYDTANATAGDRLQLYVNGTRVTAFSTNTSSNLNNTATEWLVNTKTGTIGITGGTNYLDGYLSEVNVIDGQALTPSSFGETNSDGVWVPKRYTGTYGTNGFYLKFDDPNFAAYNIGKDSAGSNHWTPYNFNVTTNGVTYDWMTDTPTNNYATLNPLATLASSITLAGGNLDLTTGAAWSGLVQATVGVSTGKWYWEAYSTNGATPANTHGLGVSKFSAVTSSATSDNVLYVSDGNKYINFAGGTAYGATYTTGDLIGIAYDADTGTLEFFKNGTSQGTWTPSGYAGVLVFPTFGDGTGASLVYNFNFGQRPFAYTPPTGFKALCTANLPSGSITTSGSFTGNTSTDGPFVWLNGNPSTMTINGNAVTWGTHADKLAGGFKVRSSSASYNSSGSNTYSVSVTGKLFGDVAHAPNNAQGNP